MVDVEVPFDIWYMIVVLVGKPSHPLSYTIDTASLHALSLVSRLLHTVVTPILYSTITLADPRSAGCLMATAKSNPRLLQWCHSMRWLGWRLPFVEDAILSTMTGLRRFITSQTTWHPLESLPRSTITELVFPQLPFQMLCHQCTQYAFPNLERLFVKSISLTDEARNVEAFRKMPRLTHFVASEVGDLHHVDTIAVLDYLPLLCKLILGFESYFTRFRGVLITRDGQVVLMPYNQQFDHGSWFGDRIVDGTLWEMDSPEYSELPEFMALG
jgi:hypothetical protein